MTAGISSWRNTRRAAASLSAFAQSVGYLVATTGPLAVGFLHTATGGWTVMMSRPLMRHDEVIVSTLPQRVSHWLRRDVPSRLEALGVPVTVVTAAHSSRSLIT